MLGSVVHDPVGASPLRPDRVLRTNRAGVLLDLGPLCVRKNMPFGRCVRRWRWLQCPPGRQGVSSLYGRARPPHIGRAGGRAGHLARPSLYSHIWRLCLLQMLRFSMLHGVVFGQSFRLGMCGAHGVLSMGLFSDETHCPTPNAPRRHRSARLSTA